jgi:hypothetical protein
MNLLVELDIILDAIRCEIDQAERHGHISPNEKRDLRTRVLDARKEIKGVGTDLLKLKKRPVPGDFP